MIFLSHFRLKLELSSTVVLHLNKLYNITALRKLSIVDVIYNVNIILPHSWKSKSFRQFLVHFNLGEILYVNLEEIRYVSSLLGLKMNLNSLAAALVLF